MQCCSYRVDLDRGVCMLKSNRPHLEKIRMWQWLACLNQKLAPGPWLGWIKSSLDSVNRTSVLLDWLGLEEKNNLLGIMFRFLWSYKNKMSLVVKGRTLLGFMKLLDSCSSLLWLHLLSLCCQELRPTVTRLDVSNESSGRLPSACVPVMHRRLVQGAPEHAGIGCHPLHPDKATKMHRHKSLLSRILLTLIPYLL